LNVYLFVQENRRDWDVFEELRFMIAFLVFAFMPTLRVWCIELKSDRIGSYTIWL